MVFLPLPFQERCYPLPDFVAADTPAKNSLVLISKGLRKNLSGSIIVKPLVVTHAVTSISQIILAQAWDAHAQNTFP